MTATIISNQLPYTFGQQTNAAISRLIALNTQLLRLDEAIATASAGYEGEPGTQFEMPAGGLASPATNLFGVQPGAVPGDAGQTYRYAMDQLTGAWKTFWDAASQYIEQLDNGGGGSI